MKKHAAPIIAAMLLILPVLYSGSYLALVRPGDYDRLLANSDSPDAKQYVKGYRFEGNSNSPLARVAPFLFWPLEQIDRKLRPTAWGPDPGDPFR